jgi:hypothetical protein
MEPSLISLDRDLKYWWPQEILRYYDLLPPMRLLGPESVCMSNIFTDEEARIMDMYLWLDYTIEKIWLAYIDKYQGDYSITYEDEKYIMEMMELVYDMETTIIDLIDRHAITFSMIDLYKEMYDVRSWPTRFC